MPVGARIQQRVDFSQVLKASDIKDVIDAGLEDHRREHLPRHFERSAPAEYYPAYKRESSQHKGMNYRSLQEILDAMNPASLAQWKRMQETAQKGAYKRAKLILQAEEDSLDMTDEELAELTSADRRAATKLPLVDTGQLRLKITRGTGRFTGSVNRRRLVLDTPFYFNFHKEGQMNKRRALSATTAAEQEKIAEVMDAAMQTKLNQNARQATRRR